MARRVGFGDETDQPAKKRRAIPIALLTLWLIGWTVGIVIVLNALLGALDDPGTGAPLLLIGWLVFAAAGWLLGARLLMRMATGKPAGRGKPARDPRDFPTEQRNEPAGGGDV